jgi:single-stranded-DNA-specific exonuclease
MRSTSSASGIPACSCASAGTRWPPAARSRPPTSKSSAARCKASRAKGLDAATLERTLISDGPLAAEHFDPATVRLLDDQVWGSAFDAPLFCDAVEVVSQRLVGEKHLKLAVRVGGVVRDAIWFGRVEPVEDRVRLAWRLGLDAYNGVERVQMIVVAID